MPLAPTSESPRPTLELRLWLSERKAQAPPISNRLSPPTKPASKLSPSLLRCYSRANRPGRSRTRGSGDMPQSQHSAWGWPDSPTIDPRGGGGTTLSRHECPAWQITTREPRGQCRTPASPSRAPNKVHLYRSAAVPPYAHSHESAGTGGGKPFLAPVRPARILLRISHNERRRGLHRTPPNSKAYVRGGADAQSVLGQKW